MHDLLLQAGQATRHFRSPRIASRNIHGAGCTLSSAVACHLALGLGLDLGEAVDAARTYVHQAIAAGAAVQTGAGHGPLNHGAAPRAMQVR